MRFSAIMVVMFAIGCTAPAPAAECGPDGECPEGQVCGADNMCRAGVVDARENPGGDGADVDSGGDADMTVIDAAPDACVSNMDCQNPPPCFEPGTCDLTTSTCDYPATDCSDLNGECSMGVCSMETGQCERQPANEGTACGDPARICDEVQGCDYDNSICQETDTKLLDCTYFTCQAGVCQGGEEVREEEACPMRNTEGNACTAPADTGPSDDRDDTSCNNFGQCGGFASDCDESGTQSRTCDVYACEAGACVVADTTSDQRGCNINTDGDECGNDTLLGCDTCGGFTGGICDESGSQSCDYNQPLCQSGSCSDSRTETRNESCTVDKDGLECNFCCDKPEQDFCPEFCNNGSCPSC